jgi:hypothetical protein
MGAAAALVVDAGAAADVAAPVSGFAPAFASCRCCRFLLRAMNSVYRL